MAKRTSRSKSKPVREDRVLHARCTCGRRVRMNLKINRVDTVIPPIAVVCGTCGQTFELK